MPNPASAKPELLPTDPQASTLRISRQELDRLRTELDQSGNAEASVKREFMRWPFDRLVKVELQQPGVASVTLTFACRNISRGGLSLLHRAFIYPGTKAIVTMPHPSKGTIALTGIVRRCRHFKNAVHDVGIQFDKPCNVRELLGLGQADNCYLLERVDPEKLSGGVLMVEDSEMDRVIVREAVSKTNLSITAADTGAQAIERASAGGFDVILCSMDLADMTGLKVLECLREKGITTPFVLVSAETTDALREAVRQAKPDGFIARPINSDGLLSVLGEILLLPGEDASGASPMITSLPDAHPMLQHVASYIDELKNYAEKIKKAITDNDAATARRVSFQIKGSAPTFGFETLGKLADAACTQLTATPSAHDAADQLSRLAAGCLRARAKVPAVAKAA